MTQVKWDQQWADTDRGINATAALKGWCLGDGNQLISGSETEVERWAMPILAGMRTDRRGYRRSQPYTAS